MQKLDKALLVISFGTTHEETRAATIDAIEADLAAAFPDRKLYRGWTSGMILRILKKRAAAALEDKNHSADSCVGNAIARSQDSGITVPDSVEEALAAVRNGADCLGVGAMFSTSTKTDVDVLSMDTLRAICNAVEIPVVAIGGISRDNLLQLSGTGVDGVALVSAIFGAGDIEKECRQLRRLAAEMVGV